MVEPPAIDPLGFRDYDARWRFGTDIGLEGLAVAGRAFGTLMRRRGLPPQVIAGHDFRSYQPKVKEAVVKGLVAAGCHVLDIGLALTPMAYFARIDLGVAAVAMVTASHNPDGWTGLKLGLAANATLLPDDMAELRDIAMGAACDLASGGRHEVVSGIPQRYAAALRCQPPLQRKLKVVVACGNGTAGCFAPDILSAAGLDVVPLDCELDAGFPNCDPNPEDMRMLARLGAAVRAHGADAGFALDGDGDRCGFVDETGTAISADRAGLLLARAFAERHPGRPVIVDVKSTGLFASDAVLRRHGAAVEYWKTGHSHMRARLHQTGAIAAFEKSGHFYFNAPEGPGYDDAIATILAFCRLLDESTGNLSGLNAALGNGFATPTLSPFCADDRKYRVVEAVRRHFETCREDGTKFAGRAIAGINPMCGVRIALEDGSWALVRASSNKPELAVVCESRRSEADMRGIFAAIAAHLSVYPEIGAYNQTLATV